MIITTITTFTDPDGNQLDVRSEESGAVSLYAPGNMITITPDAIPALLAAVQHAAGMAAASTPAVTP